ncbi:MAG: putative porin [Verrucomicrobiota bacterium]
MQYFARNGRLRIGKAGKREDVKARALGLYRFDAAVFLAACWLLAAGSLGLGQESHDPLLDLMIQKGMITQEEARKVQTEADANLTNAVKHAMSSMDSKWDINKAFKKLELYGDVRVRYEQRQAVTPDGASMELDRFRYALRLGLRGDLFDDVYFGLRLETSTNPRSTWVTFGGASPGPFGKSNAGIDVGQAYLGWRPGDWLDITLGKMPNPLYTTPMVWDPDLNPEGAAERLKYTVGNADLFATFGQFVYQDNNPSYISGSLVPYVYPPGSPRQETSTSTTFLLAWQGGVNYRFTENISAKAAASLYNYIGLVTNDTAIPYYTGGVGDTFIGEGAYGGKKSIAPINGLTTEPPIYYNQVGVNNLTVVEVPAEVNFKIGKVNARVFGDYAFNLDGAQRAKAAVKALAAQNKLQQPPGSPPLLTYGAQVSDVVAYQIGFAIGNGDKLGLATGSVAKKNTWELRSYWQSIGQYALDPNLLDSDVFEGRGNLQGVVVALAYSLTDNLIATVRYANARRINDKVGTGGSNLDIPQINPIQHYNLLQLDVTLKF